MQSSQRMFNLFTKLSFSHLFCAVSGPLSRNVLISRHAWTLLTTFCLAPPRKNAVSSRHGATSRRRNRLPQSHHHQKRMCLPSYQSCVRKVFPFFWTCTLWSYHKSPKSCNMYQFIFFPLEFCRNL